MNRSPEDDYLWDGSGTPDPFVQSLEETLACLASPAQLEIGQQPQAADSSRAMPWKELAIASMVAAAVLAALWLWKAPPTAKTNEVVNPVGDPKDGGSPEAGDDAPEPTPASPDLKDPFAGDASPDGATPRGDVPELPELPEREGPGESKDGSPDLKNPFATSDSGEPAPNKKGKTPPATVDKKKKKKSKPSKGRSPDLADPFSDEPAPPAPQPAPKDPFKGKGDPEPGRSDLANPFKD